MGVVFRFVLLLGLILTCSVPIRASAEDGWHFRGDRSSSNPFFWDFKYFNFHTSEIYGSLTYFVAGPILTRKMSVTARLMEARTGKVYSYYASFPLKCVRTEPNSAHLDLCGSGGMESLGPGRYRVYLSDGAFRWNLRFVSNPSFSGREDLKISLDGAVFDWGMTWNPALPDATAEGSFGVVESGRLKTYEASAAPAYHDSNWGVWDPIHHPFRQLHFAGVDSSGKRVAFILGEFNENSKPGLGGRIYREGAPTIEIAPGSYRFEVSREGRAPIARYSTVRKETLVLLPANPDFSAGDRAIPVEYSVEDLSADFRLKAVASASESSAPSLPAWLRNGKFDFAIDEQSVAIEFEFRDESGRIRTAKGIGEFMRGGPQRPGS